MRSASCLLADRAVAADVDRVDHPGLAVDERLRGRQVEQRPGGAAGGVAAGEADDADDVNFWLPTFVVTLIWSPTSTSNFFAEARSMTTSLPPDAARPARGSTARSANR